MKEDHKRGGIISSENLGVGNYKSASNGPPLISCFKPPIYASVPKPFKNVTLKEIYKAISGDYFKQVTQEAHQNFKKFGSKTWPDSKGKEHNPFRIIKESKLFYFTFAGTFSQRSNGGLITESDYYCFDLDHLKDVNKERKRILDVKDEYFKTNLLFTSPSGEGLKWIVSLDPNEYSYSDNYRGLQVYLKKEYGITKIDNTYDISRACFLCHDPKAYYNEV